MFYSPLNLGSTGTGSTKYARKKPERKKGNRRSNQKSTSSTSIFSRSSSEIRSLLFHHVRKFRNMTGDSVAVQRLRQERKNWRKDHPTGFWARPETNADGSLDLMKWKAGVPGKTGTDWEGGVFPLSLTFSNDYPSKPPKVMFTPPIYHPNVFPSGNICLSILNESKDWKPSVTLKQILQGVQDLLDAPNVSDPAQGQAAKELRTNPAAYKRKVRQLALKFREE